MRGESLKTSSSTLNCVVQNEAMLGESLIRSYVEDRSTMNLPSGSNAKQSMKIGPPFLYQALLTGRLDRAEPSP